MKTASARSFLFLAFLVFIPSVAAMPTRWKDATVLRMTGDKFGKVPIIAPDPGAPNGQTVYNRRAFYWIRTGNWIYVVPNHEAPISPDGDPIIAVIDLVMLMKHSVILVVGSQIKVATHRALLSIRIGNIDDDGTLQVVDYAGKKHTLEIVGRYPQ